MKTRMLVFWLVLVVAVLGLFYFTPGSATGNQLTVETVLRMDALRLKAMGEGDGVALAKIFSDQMMFIHSDGRSEWKADYIKNLTAGDTAYSNLKTTDVKARQITTDVIVVSGAQEMKKKLGASWLDINLRFISVWRNERGTWRMVAWQSMKPSGNSVVPPK